MNVGNVMNVLHPYGRTAQSRLTIIKMWECGQCGECARMVGRLKVV